MKCFRNALVYVAGEGLKRCDLAFGEKITSFTGEGEEIPLPQDAVVLPGFIDEHIHGAGGSDAMDATGSALSTIAKTVAEEGTTGFLATTMTQSPAAILASMRAVKEYRAEAPREGAAVLGVHLEGPFIACKFKGAQPEEYVAKPDTKVFDEYNEASGNAIKIVTLAPEAEGAQELIRHLTKKGIVASVGHTAAKYADLEQAVIAGVSNVTHTYNAQSPLHHRDIGTVGCALLDDRLNCELIADTIHVSVPAIRLLVKCKPQDKLTLITDAIRAKGLGDGESELGGQKVFVKNGEARLADGTLAGSVLRMNRAIENLVKKAGVPFLRAVDCATVNPAHNLGIEKQAGSIALGKNADFAVLDGNYNVVCTVRGGNVVYARR